MARQATKTSTEASPATAPAKVEIASIDLTSCTSKSSKMRLLASTGHFTTSEIAKYLGVKYQFVRNVLNQKTASAA